MGRAPGVEHHHVLARRVYRTISESLLGERAFKAAAGAEGADEGRYWRLIGAMTAGGRAIEDAVDLDDPVLVKRLRAVFDRIEERLGDDGPAP